MLRMLELKHWREAASYYDQDPRTQMVDDDDKQRMLALSMGVKNALVGDLDEVMQAIKTAEKDPDWWAPSKEKKRHIKAQAHDVLGTKKKQPRTMGKT